MQLELICVIVNFGMASKVLKKAKSCGVAGGTIVLATGTAHRGIWSYMGLTDTRKEILYMVTERNTAFYALDKISEEFKFHKPNHGIAFTTSVGKVIGTAIQEQGQETERGEEGMYQVITVVVNKGSAEDVIDSATKAGSKGGTIIHGRGSGIHETTKLFGMEIEPEKEIVIILSEVDATEAIVENIRKDLQIDEPGKGIIYVQDVSSTYGLYK